jgi:hypothetical protein
MLPTTSASIIATLELCSGIFQRALVVDLVGENACQYTSQLGVNHLIQWIG